MVGFTIENRGIVCMNSWYELRFWYADSPRPLALYEFKRDALLPVLQEYSVPGFLILDEPEFMLLRIETDNQTSDAIKAHFEENLPPHFSRVTVNTWSPTHDARNRILSAKRRLPGSPLPDDDSGWKVQGKNASGRWIVSPQNLDEQVEAFARFMTRVLGTFTERYLLEMPFRVEDRWLMSVFLHLMLDSISVWQTEEKEIREFLFY
jgi:hypothetical protein